MSTYNWDVRQYGVTPPPASEPMRSDELFRLLNPDIVDDEELEGSSAPGGFLVAPAPVQPEDKQIYRAVLNGGVA